jgi:hypothetical protein
MPKEPTNELPDKLYRYRSLSNLGRVIQEISSVHWFSTAEYLNDPFDGIADLKETEIDEIRLVTGRLEGESESKVFPARVRGKEKWMIACFTNNWNSAPMWAHYTSNGAGVCLVYDPIIVNKQLHKHQIQPYIGTRVAPLFKKVDYKEILPDDTVDIEERIFSKAKPWEYESEYRAALLGIEMQDKKGGMMVNLDGSMNQVLIGWRAGSEVYTPILDLVNKLRGRGIDIEVGRVSPDKSTRELKIDWPWKNLHDKIKK